MNPVIWDYNLPVIYKIKRDHGCESDDHFEKISETINRLRSCDFSPIYIMILPTFVILQKDYRGYSDQKTSDP